MTRARQGGAVVPLLGALTALAIVVAGVAITLQMQERNQRLAKERELVLVKAEIDDLQQRLTDAKSAKQQLEETLTRSKAQLDEVSAQVTQERQEKEGLAKAVDQRQQEIDRLAKDLDQAKTERAGLTDQLTKSKSELKVLQKRLAQAEKVKADLEARSNELASSSTQPTVNLDTVVVNNTGADAEGAAAPTGTGASPSASSGVSSPTQGQVVVVYRDYDFVVVNLGKNHGLEIGQEFQIMRGSEILGHVKFEKVYDELAAAAILPDSKKDAIREGDLLKAI